MRTVTFLSPAVWTCIALLYLCSWRASAGEATGGINGVRSHLNLLSEESGWNNHNLKQHNALDIRTPRGESSLPAQRQSYDSSLGANPPRKILLDSEKTFLSLIFYGLLCHRPIRQND